MLGLRSVSTTAFSFLVDANSENAHLRPLCYRRQINASGTRRSGKLAGLWRWFKKALPNACKRPGIRRAGPSP